MPVLSRLAESLTSPPRLTAHFPFTLDHKLGLALIAALLLTEGATGPRPLAERLAQTTLALRWSGFYAALALLLLLGRWQNTGFIYAGF